MAKTSRAIEYVELIREATRLNKAAVSVGGTDVSLVESHILTEAALTPRVSQTVLAERLVLYKQAISRACRALSNAGAIVVRPGATDARSREVMPTARGESMLATIDEAANRQVRTVTKGLSRSELAELERLFHRVCDGMGVPAAGARAEEEPIRAAVRRNTRAFQMMSSDLFGTGVSPLEWQLLSALRDSPRALVVAPLADYLACPPRTLTEVLRRLEQRKLVARLPHPDDGRKISLQLTFAGREALSKVVSAIAEKVDAAFEKLPRRDTERLLELLRRVTHIAEPERAVKLSRLKTASHLDRARRLFIERAALLPKELPISETLYAREGLSYGIFVGDELAACIDLVTSKGSELWMENIGWNEELLSAANLMNALEEVCREIASERPKAELCIHRTNPFVRYVPAPVRHR